jgi:hypothetical protein
MYKIIGADQKEYGPIGAEQLRQWIAEGRLSAQTPAQLEGETTWKPISLFPEFAASFPSAPLSPLPPPPLGGMPITDSGAREAALAKVNLPAIFLIVTGGLTLAFSILGLVLGLLGFDQMNAGAFQQSQTPEMERINSMARGAGATVVRVLGLATGILTILGGMKMRKLESRGLCIAGSIVSMLPCSCCCLIGLPIGIWALVVLNDANVKESFSS